MHTFRALVFITPVFLCSACGEPTRPVQAQDLLGVWEGVFRCDGYDYDEDPDWEMVMSLDLQYCGRCVVEFPYRGKVPDEVLQEGTYVEATEAQWALADGVVTVEIPGLEDLSDPGFRVVLDQDYSVTMKFTVVGGALVRHTKSIAGEACTWRLTRLDEVR